MLINVALKDGRSLRRDFHRFYKSFLDTFSDRLFAFLSRPLEYCPEKLSANGGSQELNLNQIPVF